MGDPKATQLGIDRNGKNLAELLKELKSQGQISIWLRDKKPNMSINEVNAIIDSIPDTKSDGCTWKFSKRKTTLPEHKGRTLDDQVFELRLDKRLFGVTRTFYLKGYFLGKGVYIQEVSLQSARKLRRV